MLAETGALLDKIDGLIAMKTPTDKKKREEHRGAMASAVNDLYAAFYLKKWAERCPREFHTANQVAERIRRIVVFFILSCRRGANKETMPSLMHAIEVNIFKNKKLYNKVLKFAQRATKAFDAEQKELNGEQECLKSGITDYMASFITMRNYIVRNHVRVVFFFKKDGELQRFSSYRPSKHSGSVDTLTRRLRRGKSSIDDSRDVDEGADCGVHEGLATVDCCALKDAVRLAPDDPPSPASTDAFLIKKLQDLQQTNTPHNSCKKRAWGNKLTACSPDVSAIDDHELVFCVILNTEGSEVSRAKWETDISNSSVEDILLSYAFHHVKEGETVPRDDAYKAIDGTSRGDQSLGMVQHVFCTTMDKCKRAPPKWERIDEEGYGLGAFA